MSEEGLKQVLVALEQAQKALTYAQREMNSVWNYLSPNSSNDMEWADEVIIAIEQKVQAALATQQPQGVPEGWVLVPKQPTDSILYNIYGRNLVYATDAELQEAWAEIIAAAPSPERQG